MTDTSLNPGAAGFHNWFTNGTVRQQFLVNDEVMGDLPLGTVVQIDPYLGPEDLPTTNVPTIQPSSTGLSVSVIGVVSAGTDLSGVSNVPPGKVATVTCVGVTRILVDASTVAGEYLIQSPGTPGAARTSSSPTTPTFGVCLESVTVSSGTALAWCYVDIQGGGGGGGGGGVPTLDLTYNGNGPVPVQVLDGLAYDPSVGGYIFGTMPAALTTLGGDVAAFILVDGANNITSFMPTFSPATLNDVAEIIAYDAEQNPCPVWVIGLSLLSAGSATSNPGNTPNSVNAFSGMIVYTSDGTNGYLWLCIASYDPSGPTDAVWVQFISGGGGGGASFTYNGSPDRSSGGPFPIGAPTQPLAQQSGVLQTMPPSHTVFYEIATNTVNVELINAGDSLPQGVCAGADGNIWVADKAGVGGVPGVWKIGLDGTQTFYAFTDPTAIPNGICSGSDGNIYVADEGTASIWQVTPAGSMNPPYSLSSPTGNPDLICAGPDGNLYASDATNNGVWRVSPAGATTFISLGVSISNVCAGPDGNVYAMDTTTPAIIAVKPDGSSTSITLPGGANPEYCCTGQDGNIYAIDPATIYVVNPLTATVVNTISWPDNGLSQPVAAPDGNIYIANTGNAYLTRLDPYGNTSVLSPFTFSFYLCISPDGSLVATTYGVDLFGLWILPSMLALGGGQVDGGDLTFLGRSAGPTGPVIKDLVDGHTYRIICSSGVLSTTVVT